MNRRTLALVSAWIVIMAAVGWTLWERRVMALSADETAVRQSELAQLGDKTKAIETRTTRLAGDVEVAQRQLERARQPASVHPPTVTTVERSTETDRDQQRTVRERAMFALRLLPAIKRLGLSPEVAAKLTALFAERMAQGSDVYNAAREQHVSTELPTIRSLMQQNEDEFRNKVTALLGEDGWRVVETFQGSIATIGLQAIAGDLSLSPEPLSPTQADALRDALGLLGKERIPITLARPFSFRENEVMSGYGVEQLQADLAGAERFRATVLPLLTPTQRVVVENRLNLEELRLRLVANSYTIWRSVRKAGANGATAP